MNGHADGPTTAVLAGLAALGHWCQWAIAPVLAAATVASAAVSMIRLYVDWPDLKSRVRARRRGQSRPDS